MERPLPPVGCIAAHEQDEDDEAGERERPGHEGAPEREANGLHERPGSLVVEAMLLLDHRMLDFSDPAPGLVPFPKDLDDVLAHVLSGVPARQDARLERHQGLKLPLQLVHALLLPGVVPGETAEGRDARRELLGRLVQRREHLGIPFEDVGADLRGFADERLAQAVELPLDLRGVGEPAFRGEGALVTLQQERHRDQDRHGDPDDEDALAGPTPRTFPPCSLPIPVTARP